ncbi:hypothetical protein CLOM_g10854 [Closterium sp. NIES-68]|nr:hypothetical protein CLOM_g10854 [Closterium sp. NIES-68]GJP74811.1 hypothetical protein CLOP_g5345 [Closterium sp. NIES-67]
MWELRCVIQKQVMRLSLSTRNSASPNHSSTSSNVTSNETPSLKTSSLTFSSTASSNDSSDVINDSNDNEVSCSEKAEVSSAAGSNCISSVIPLSDTSSVVSDVDCCDNTSDEVSVVSSSDVSCTDVSSSDTSCTDVSSSDTSSSDVSCTSDFTSPNVTTVEVPVVNMTSRTTDSALCNKSRAAKAAAASARLLPSLIPKPRAIVRVTPAVEQQPRSGEVDAGAQPAASARSTARHQQERKSSMGCRGRQPARSTRAVAVRPHWRP